MLKNELGNKFGRLLVIARAPNYKDGSARWECQCDCGNIVIVNANPLRRGITKSCGCFSKEQSTKHCMCFSFEYKSWQGMKDRCCNPRNVRYWNYGGRGITVCDRWINNFENFFSDMGERNKYQSIERIDNNKGYFPDNCIWANATQQANNRSNSHVVVVNGESNTISQWARKIGITPAAFAKRIRASNNTDYLLAQRMK